MKTFVWIVTAAALAAGCSKSGGGDPSKGTPEPGGGEPAVGPPAALPTGAVRLQRVEIHDETGFAKKMLAGTALIPAGWTAQGGVVWSPHGPCGNDYGLQWQAAAPDGSSGIAIIAAANWSGTRSAYPLPQQNPCGEAFHRSAREYLEASARQLHADARVLEYTPLPDEATPYQAMLDQHPPLDTPTAQTRASVDAGELLIGYRHDGREMRALLTVTVFLNEARYADINNPGQIGFETVGGFPVNLTVVRAPVDQLDRGLRKRVLGSMRSTPAWMKAIGEFNQRKMQQFSEAMAAGHAARMGAIKQRGEILNGMYEDRVLTGDRQQRETIEAIRGVETYQDTDGRPVQLDATYASAWRASDSTYILSNDPGFSPGRYGIEAQRLQALE